MNLIKCVSVTPVAGHAVIEIESKEDFLKMFAGAEDDVAIFCVEKTPKNETENWVIGETVDLVFIGEITNEDIEVEEK